jgi:4-hydroxy-tetrahydrodipicolinate reductase
MKIGVFGKGKTGQEVIKLLSATHVYDSKNLPDKNVSLDAMIIFIPPKAFINHFDLLLSLKCPLIIGTTGIEWTDEIKEQILRNKKTWVHAANFSLGMLLVRKALSQINSLLSILKDPQINIIETHHTDKKDAPSGTAILWNSWLDNRGQIRSLREGDTIGYHEATILTAKEKITISHEAIDRKLFAEGAIWCANVVVKSKLSTGLYSFESIVDQYSKDQNV